ncbi:sterol desaturase family protein [Allomesorhizobium camelthorni]|uniref:Sterol desaturase family protein n=1 Tax=Allomesorhizobium camelthorni TaxID=475069 RepID=A0A6G4WI62_9HYPH|nr:sterol desaturase family protein [Mesorhizobium camelthorni]NGO53883.1 sterol desaturase family protein [Mesorhizobium camelthorni]
MALDDTKPDVTLPVKSTWNYHPNLPLQDRSLFNLKRGPLEGLKLLWNSWLPISDRLIVVGMSFLTWYYLSPSLETTRTFSFDWIAAVYLRNLALIVLVAGGMHLYLYTFKMQGNRLRYDARPFHKKNALFTFNSQFLDNVFWSIASGVTIWTAYEVIGLWAYANGYMPMLDFATHPVWFVLWFVFLPFYGVVHFYWIHRLLHWGPLYNYAHSLHHRNVNVGPWSGMSMHPIEHIGYLSSVLIHVVLASHPIHFIFHLQQKVLLAVSSHAGYESVTAGEDSDAGLKVGDFFHQLHHRYFECNYGEPEVPCDKWFGTFHDGSEEATARTRVRTKEMRKK